MRAAARDITSLGGRFVRSARQAASVFRSRVAIVPQHTHALMCRSTVRRRAGVRSPSKHRDTWTGAYRDGGPPVRRAVETARADRELAGNRRDAGLVTDADVLQLDVYISRAREQQVQTASDERIARAELNQLMGEPLDATFALDPLATATAIDSGNVAALEAEAIENRPDVKLAALQEQLASATVTAARAAFLPQVSAQAGWEFNGGAWNSRASSWVVGAGARINVFRGFAGRARLAEAREQVTGRMLERKKAETSARLDVLMVITRLEAAHASEVVGRAAVEQSRESRRIIRDRYEAGLTDVGSLLRAAEAVVQAETQQTAAQVAVLTEAAALERALGRR